MKRPAYGNAVFDRRKAREVLWLLVVGIGGWKAGDGLFDRPDVARVVVLDEFDLARANWDFAAGLDVLVVGDSEVEGRELAVLTALLTQARPNTVWWLDEPLIDEMVLVAGTPAAVGLSPVMLPRFAGRLAARREAMALTGQGIWAGRESPQRAALMARLQEGMA